MPISSRDQSTVMVVGATGLIGSAVAARLVREGYSVIAVSRSGRGLPLNSAKTVRLDLASADFGEWQSLLTGVDAVVNCVGILQDGPGESVEDTHVRGLALLLKASEHAEVRRFVHLSAAGIDRDIPSRFSESKHAGELLVKQQSLEWVILRPSIVIGVSAYGGSALIRGLASLPILPVMPKTGDIQAVSLEDVVSAVVIFLRTDSPSRAAYDLVGPETFSFAQLIHLVRRWLGWKPQQSFPVPPVAAAAVYLLGDAISLLGWRPPVRTNARREIVRGATGDGSALAAIGFQTRSLTEDLASRPASVQERWFASLYIIKPLLFIILVLFWISTGFISLGPGWDYGIGLMKEGGVEGRLAALTVVAGASADIVIGLAIAYRPISRYGLWAAIGLALAYAIIGTVLVPRLWADPLGPMLKIWPVIMLHWVALAILEDR